MTSPALEFPFADIAVALKIEANILADRAQDVETTALRIGLSPPVAARIVAERRRQADLVAAAHRIIYALMPVEGTISAVISEGT